MQAGIHISWAILRLRDMPLREIAKLSILVLRSLLLAQNSVGLRCWKRISLVPTCLVKTAGQNEFWTDERCYITELCNTERLPASSLAIARVVAGVTTQLHSLTGITETYIIIDGAGGIEVDGEYFEIGPGDQVVIPAGMPQRISALGTRDLRFYCMCTPRFVPQTYENLEASSA